MDKIYTVLLTFTFIFSIPLCIRFPEYTILYALMIIFSPLALQGTEIYRKVLGKILPGRETGNEYTWSFMGFVPGLFAVLAEWGSVNTAVLMFGAIAAIMVAVSEETFRAGSIVYLLRTGLKPQYAIVIANAMWILFHFAIRPFDLFYFLFLSVAAIVFTFVLVKGGLGAAVLAHILSNSLASWIVLSTYNLGMGDLSYSSLAILMIIVFMIPLIGGIVKWQGR